MHHAFLYTSEPSLHDYNVIMLNFTFCRGRENKTTTFFFCLLARTSPFVAIFWFEYWILVLKCYREFRERGNRTTAEINFNKVTTFVIKRIRVSDESWISLHPPYKLHKYQNPQLGRCDINARTSHTASCWTLYSMPPFSLDRVHILKTRHAMTLC